jgi:hypothetical protein
VSVPLSVENCLRFLEDNINNNRFFRFHTFPPFWPPFRFRRSVKPHQFKLRASLRKFGGLDIGVGGLFIVKGSVTANGNCSVVSCTMTPPLWVHTAFVWAGALAMFLLYRYNVKYAAEIMLLWLLVGNLKLLVNWCIASRIFMELDRVFESARASSTSSELI